MGFRNNINLKSTLFLGLLLLLLLLLVAVSFRSNGVLVEASRPLLNLQKGYNYNSEILATLGIECKCCDGIGGKCSTDFTADSCSNLHCSPWKQY